MSSDGTPSWVCLLRGVNLGQRRRLPMVPAPDRAGRLTGDPALAGICRVDGRHVYVDYVGGYHNTGRTAAWFNGTERNWRTVLAMARLAASS
jgi:uncharacterized protein (DUF1697 family)